jgi:pyridoxal phosphate enzyme (YggS family)
MDAGHTLFGENYVQELVSKAQAVGQGAEWHFIGHLQTNKVKKVVGVAGTVQTVDRAELAAELEKRAAAAGVSVDCLIEVNVGGEESKSGVSPEGVRALIEACRGYSHLGFKGLMCIPPFGPSEQTRPYFARLRALLSELRAGGAVAEGFRELSMGMSGDVEAAVEEGATLVRVGTAIFGER